MVLVLSENRRSALAQALSEPLSVLGDRSPGACETAQLRPTKATRAPPCRAASIC